MPPFFLSAIKALRGIYQTPVQQVEPRIKVIFSTALPITNHYEQAKTKAICLPRPATDGQRTGGRTDIALRMCPSPFINFTLYFHVSNIIYFIHSLDLFSVRYYQVHTVTLLL